MDEEQLRALFAQYGTIVHSKILRDFDTNTSKGQAFVKFDTIKAADYAISGFFFFKTFSHFFRLFKSIKKKKIALNGYVFPNTTKGIGVRYADTPEEKQQRKSMKMNRMQQQSFQKARFNPYGVPGK